LIFCSITNPHGDGLSSPSFPTSPQSHTHMYTSKRFQQKMQHDVVLWQIIMHCPRLLDCIHGAQKCPSQFHQCSFKCHETFARLKIWPSTLRKLSIVGRFGFGYMYFNISLNVPPFHHNWYAYMVSAWVA
jgi:hypothetical protein